LIFAEIIKKTMKKTIKLAIATSVLVAVTFSCQKKGNQPQTANTVEEVKTTQTNAGQKPDPSKTINACYDPKDKRHPYCWELVRCNCTILKEIVVSPHFTDLIRTASGGTNPQNSNPVLVAQLFNNAQFQNVFDRIPDAHLASLRSGNYNLAIKYEDATKICLLAGPTKPVTASNMAFALQYNK
jgi:hypothetical protein